MLRVFRVLGFSRLFRMPGFHGSRVSGGLLGLELRDEQATGHRG